MDLTFPDSQNIHSAELVEVSGDFTNYDVTESGIGLNQSLEDAEERNIVGVSGRYEIAASDQNEVIPFSLNKGCLGKTTLRISSLMGDAPELLFEYVYQASGTSSGCDLLQFAFNPSDLTVNQTDNVTRQTESDYSLEQDPNYIAGAQMFDEEEALKHIETLASDELQGRFVGTPGSQDAGDYIAGYFEEHGLQPAGVNSSYFQPFTTTANVHVDQPILSITSPTTHTYVTHNEYSPRIGKYLGTGDATGEVIWLGNCSPSSFDISLAEQIILCGPLAGLDFHQAVAKALQYNVGGLLIFAENNDPYPRSGYSFGELIDMPAFSISQAIAEDILAGSEYDINDLNQLDAHTTLGTTVSMASSFETREVQGRNVLGLLPGADPAFKDEIVIIGAHYDHVGTDPDGTIYNGANDNASGIAVIMEIVRLWQEQDIQPARSVLFVAWDAEEVGLKGALYYVSTPIYPLANTVAYINVDCVGVGDILYAYGEGAVADQLQDSADTFGFSVNLRPEAVGDDQAFVEDGILAASYIVLPENAPIYQEMHRPEDDPQIIQLDWLRTVGILSAHALFELSGDT